MRPFHRHEDGETLIIFSFMLPVLLGAAASTIDLSNLCYNASVIQRAADSAALGGVLALTDQQLDTDKLQ